MKAIFGEVFIKISNGIFMGCLGAILIGWGLYENSDTLMLIGIALLAVGFILATVNEERRIKEFNDLKVSNSKLRNRVKDQKYQIEELQDAVMYLSQDMEQVSKELATKNRTIDLYKKIKVSALRNKEVWSKSEDI